MKWFKHFSNAHDNKDLTKVRMRYGAEGYAIYWYCLELISGNLGTADDINFELTHDSEVIGFNLKIDTLRVEEIMRYMIDIGLFESSEGVISCLKLSKYLDKKNTRNKKIHEIIDAANSVRDSPRQIEAARDESRPFPLDTDTDTDTDTDIKTPMSDKSDDEVIVNDESESIDHTDTLTKPKKSGTNKTKDSGADQIDELHAKILNLYHEILPGNPKVMIPMFKGSTKESNLKARIRENKAHRDIDFWGWYFSNVAQQDWMIPGSKNGWVANFDYLVTKSKFQQLAEKFVSEGSR